MSVRAASAPTPGARQSKPQCRVSIGAPVRANRRLDKVLAVGFAKLQIKPRAKTSMQEPSAQDDAELLVGLWEYMQEEEELHNLAGQVNFGESHEAIWSERQTNVLTTAFENIYARYKAGETTKTIPDAIIKSLVAKLNQGDPAEKIATVKNVRDWIDFTLFKQRNDKSETKQERFSERQLQILERALEEHLKSKRRYFDPSMITRVINDLNFLGEPKVADEASVKRWFGGRTRRAKKKSKVVDENTRRKFSPKQLAILQEAYNSLYVAGKNTFLLETTKKDLMGQLNAIAIPDGKVLTDTDPIINWFQKRDYESKNKNVASDPGDVEAQLRMLTSTHEMESQKLDGLKYSGDPEMRREFENVYERYKHNDDVITMRWQGRHCKH